MINPNDDLKLWRALLQANVATDILQHMAEKQFDGTFALAVMAELWGVPLVPLTKKLKKDLAVLVKRLKNTNLDLGDGFVVPAMAPRKTNS